MRSLGYGIVVVMLLGCAHGDVMQKENGDYVAIGLSSSETWAMDKAVGDGRDTCKKQGKRFLLVSHKSTYQGMDRTAKGVVDTFALAANHPAYGSTSSQDDYRVQVEFKCR